MSYLQKKARLSAISHGGEALTKGITGHSTPASRARLTSEPSGFHSLVSLAALADSAGWPKYFFWPILATWPILARGGFLPGGRYLAKGRGLAGEQSCTSWLNLSQVEAQQPGGESTPAGGP